MGVDETLLGEIVLRVLALFGSAAPGQMTRVSDIDRFEGTRRIIGGIAYPANKYGRVIYAAA